jgi:hypothetical protein
MADDQESWWQPIARRERHDVPDEEGAMIMAAVQGLYRGDLAPLATYLRSGLELSYMVRRDLVHAIDGEGDPLFRLEMRKTRKGPGDALSPIRQWTRAMAIHGFIEEQIPLHNHDVEAAVHAAMEHFDVSRTTVTGARKRIKAWFKELEASHEREKSKRKRN